MLHGSYTPGEPAPSTRLTLPHMFRSTYNGQVVLFLTPRDGIRLYHSESLPPVYSSGWISCWDTHVWEPLQAGDAVTLVSQ